MLCQWNVKCPGRQFLQSQGFITTCLVFLSQEQFREIAPTANVLEDGFYANKENLSNIDRTIQTHGPQTLISNRQHKRRHKNKQLKTRSPVQSLEVSAVLLTQSKYQ